MWAVLGVEVPYSLTHRPQDKKRWASSFMFPITIYVFFSPFNNKALGARLDSKSMSSYCRGSGRDTCAEAKVCLTAQLHTGLTQATLQLH